MKWDYIGAGVTVIALGMALVLALPPPWWPKIPLWFVHVAITCGVALVIFGTGIAAFGIWPNLTAYGLPLSRAAAALSFASAAGLTFLVAPLVKRRTYPGKRFR